MGPNQGVSEAQQQNIKPQELNVTKLMEEIKLFWTIQISVCAVLGYLGKELTFGDDTYSLFKSVIIAGVAFLLLTIGAVTNLTENYYIRIEGLKYGAAQPGYEQESAVTPTLAYFYLFISGLLGSSSFLLVAKLFKRLFRSAIENRALLSTFLTGDNWLFSLFYLALVGFVIFCVISQKIQARIYKELREKGKRANCDKKKQDCKKGRDNDCHYCYCAYTRNVSFIYEFSILNYGLPALLIILILIPWNNYSVWQ